MSQTSIFDSPGGKIISEREIEIIHHFLNQKPNLKILDLGVGPGRIARTLSSYAKEIIGVDIDRKYAKRISAENADSTFFRKFGFVVADGQHLPFRDSSFDSIVCFRVLKYFPNYELGLNEMHRALSQSGLLILEISNIFSWETLLHIPTLLRTGKMGLPRLFIKPRMIRLLVQKGFKITNSVPTYILPFFFWTKIRNPSAIKFLETAQKLLLTILPQQILSRGIVIRGIRY